MKKTIGGFFMISVLFTGLGFWYFEDRMICSLSGNAILVQLKNDLVVGQYCVEYVKDVSENIALVDEDLRSVKIYLSKNSDRAYWLEVESWLKVKRASLVKLKSKFLSAIGFFERDMLVKLKKLVRFHFKNLHENYAINIDSLKTILRNQIEKWELENFANYNRQLSEYIYKKSLLDSVFKAQTLQEMVPFLQQYLLITKQPLWRSGSLLLQ